MKRVIFTFTFLFCCFCFGQEETKPYSKADDSLGLNVPRIRKEPSENGNTQTSVPIFPGGKDSLKQFIRNSTRLPLQSSDSNECIVIMVVFEIDATGRTRNAKILNQLRNESLAKYEAEAIRVVNSLPDWKPALYNGQPIKCSSMVAVPFFECGEP